MARLKIMANPALNTVDTVREERRGISHKIARTLKKIRTNLVLRKPISMNRSYLT
jgi:hypothetical protein